MQDLLSQEEIDALLNGIEGEFVPEEPGEEQLSEIIPCEPGEGQRLERSAWPGLELFAERLCRQLQAKLYQWFELPVEVHSLSYHQSSFEDYRETVNQPASLTLLQLPPLHGTSMLVVDTKLVFKLVEQFFGGEGGHARIESREFSPLELRVVGMFLERVVASLVYAWQPLQSLSPGSQTSVGSMEAIAHIAPEEPLCVSSFEVSFAGSGGELHWAAPYTMLEPLREQLRAGLASNSDTAPGHWRRGLESGLRASKVNMTYALSSGPLTLRHLLELEAGDIVPIDEGCGVIRADSRELFSARLQSTGDALAVELQGRLDQ